VKELTAIQESPEPEGLHGEPLMLVFVDASDSTRAPAYIVGTARWDGLGLSVDLGDDKPSFPISEERLGAIRPLLPALAPIADGSKYFLTLSVEMTPPGTDPEQAGYLDTGLKWPDFESS
jgi:hypothetical protein